MAGSPALSTPVSPLDYRRAEERDLRLVVGTWVGSYRTAHAAGMICMADWRDVMEKQVARVLERPDVEVWVAYNPQEESTRGDLYGWIAVERNYQVPVRERVDGRWVESLNPSWAPLVHYVYVKQPYRLLGIARGLFLAAHVSLESEFLFSCKTPVVSKVEHRIPLAHWAPLICRYPKDLR